MLQQGWAPSDSTLGPLFSAVARSTPAEECVTLLKVRLACLFYELAFEHRHAHYAAAASLRAADAGSIMPACVRLLQPGYQGHPPTGVGLTLLYMPCSAMHSALAGVA
jgi:hypothetical protein